MLETIKNGFLAVIDFFSTIINFITSIIRSIGQLFTALPDVLSSLNAAINVLPTIFISASLFCVSIAVINNLLNHKAGG